MHPIASRQQYKAHAGTPVPGARGSNAGNLSGRLQRLLTTRCLAEVPQVYGVFRLVFDARPTTLVLGMAASEHGTGTGRGGWGVARRGEGLRSQLQI